VLKPLVLILKAFLRVRELNKAYKGGLSAYGLIVMALALVKHKQLENSQDPALLLCEFINFYGKEFDSSKQGISICFE
jgi:non-canonical poly(A) RNA polymerase PAPD5/7